MVQYDVFWIKWMMISAEMLWHMLFKDTFKGFKSDCIDAWVTKNFGVLMKI